MKMVQVSALQYSLRPCDYGDGNEIDYPADFYEYTTRSGRTFCLFPPPPPKMYDYMDGRFKHGDLHVGHIQAVADRVWNQFTDLRFTLMRAFEEPKWIGKELGIRQ